MSNRINRRRFIYSASGVTAAALTMPMISRNVLGANQKVNVAAIGAGGKGAVDIGYCASENVVALCDVDQKNATKSYKRFPKAERFKDYRRMLEKMDKQIDAVTVSTPDHLHAIASLTAMKAGKHVYCQKPLTHSVHEARVMAQVAREQKVVTQMGNQGHSEVNSRRLVELVQAGVIGPVKQAHVWTDRPIWPQGQAALDKHAQNKGKAAPDTLEWDLWLGPARDRPFNAAYLPFTWRGWWDFGTGSLGDMGCHNMDMAFWALKLRDPIAVEAQSSKVNPQTCPDWSIVTYHFGQRGDMPPCTLTWYDKMKKPPASLVKQDKLPRNGCILVGEKDTLYVPHYWGSRTFVSGEAVLLGNVAILAGQKIEWDARNLKVTNVKSANDLIRRQYRKGWELPV